MMAVDKLKRVKAEKISLDKNAIEMSEYFVKIPSKTGYRNAEEIMYRILKVLLVQTVQE